DFGLRGKTAIVSGGASGIGRAISETLGACGVNVLLTYYASAEGAAETLAAIERCGASAKALRADLTQEDEAVRVVDAAMTQFGGIDILVANSGGLLQRSPVAECPLALWNAALAVNLTSMFLT